MNIFIISRITFCLVWFAFFGIKFCIALTKKILKQLGTNDHFGETTLKSPGYEEMFF
jgi:hypothetical protein